MSDEHEDFSWIEQSRVMDKELHPFVTQIPTQISVFYIYTTPNYNIGKVRRETVELEEGKLSKASLETLIKNGKEKDEAHYRYVRTFIYKIGCDPKQVLEYGHDTLDNLDTQLVELTDLCDTQFPSCVGMFHGINTVYILLQKTALSLQKRMTKRVRFDTSSRKTRRN
tara:strand:+ start:995 stop:1498 length:504 start_codon:yes stop_codon:yes gene_type:complete